MPVKAKAFGCTVYIRSCRVHAYRLQSVEVKPDLYLPRVESRLFRRWILELDLLLLAIPGQLDPVLPCPLETIVRTQIGR